jgi:pimeloyl-ACP methyl ester carboxylesterase
LAGNGNTAHVFDAFAAKLTSSYHVYRLTRRGFWPHSIAGVELSSVGSRHAESVAGLVYIDSGYSWAYYDPTLREGDLAGFDASSLSGPSRAIYENRRQYTRIQPPVLAIYAFGQRQDPAPAMAQANAFEKGVPQARVVRFPQAPHYIFVSNEADVLREINTFIATVP